MVIRRFITLIVVMFAVIAVGAQINLEQADEAYRLHDYQTAIMLYQEALNSGQHSGAMYYNLGSAYYEAGNLGRAMHNYRRAALYLPRDIDLSTNIARIRAQRATITTEETDWLNQLAELTVDTVTLYELGIVVFVVWVLFFALLAFGIFRNLANVNFRIVLAVIGIVLLAGLVLLGSRLYVETQRPAAVVLSDSAIVMSGPGTDYLQLYTIHAASEVRILDSVGEWVRFALPDGREGWVWNKDLGYVVP